MFLSKLYRVIFLLIFLIKVDIYLKVFVLLFAIWVRCCKKTWVFMRRCATNEWFQCVHKSNLSCDLKTVVPLWILVLVLQMYSSHTVEFVWKKKVFVLKELFRKEKLSIQRSVYVLTLIYGHEVWVMTRAGYFIIFFLYQDLNNTFAKMYKKKFYSIKHNFLGNLY